MQSISAHCRMLLSFVLYSVPAKAVACRRANIYTLLVRVLCLVSSSQYNEVYIIFLL